MRNFCKSDKESGVALVFAIGLLGLMLAVGIAFVGNALLFKQVAGNNSSRTQARMVAHSALSRAMASLMLYQEQLAWVKGSADSVKDFGGSYSFDEIDLSLDNGSGSDKKVTTDGLFGNSSRILLPENDLVVPKNFAVNFNAPFRKSSWGGSWVYFKVEENGDERIIGRAAWQVVSSPASILAPVFFRGVVPGVDEGNEPLRTMRWGRDIDEVYIDNGGILGDVNSTIALTSKMQSYDEIYTSYIPNISADDKVWFERWFVPEQSTDSDATVANPTPTTAETYQESAGSDRRLLRFNISEVMDVTKYSVGSGADPWYARFGADSLSLNGNSYENNPVINGEGALNLLTREAINYVYDDGENSEDCDYNLGLGDRTSLPFLRLIGNSSENITFKKNGSKDMESFRKQIAANFNDYSDADSVPTSNIDAATAWGPNRSGAGGNDDTNDWWNTAIEKKNPAFTGNELTPYIYEFGGSLAVVSEPAKSDTSDYTVGDATLKVVPVIKLVNIYPFAELEKLWDTANFYADVDLGKVSLQHKIKTVLLKKMKFNYQKNYSTDPTAPDWRDESCEVDVQIDDADTSNTSPIEQLTSPYKLEVADNWSGSGAGNKPEKITFDHSAMQNSYPVSFKDSENAKFEQKAVAKFTTVDGTAPLVVKYNVDNVADYVKDNQTKVSADAYDNTKWNEFKRILNENPSDLRFPNNVKNDAFKDSKPYSVSIVKINVEKVSMTPRIVLRGNTKAADGVKAVDDAGADYMYFAEKYTTENSGFDLDLNNETTGTTGVVWGGFRNYDPRQNLNQDDWKIDFAVKSVNNYSKFGDLDAGTGVGNILLGDVMSVDVSGSAVNGEKNSVNNDGTLFSPSGQANADAETVTDPAYSSGSRISTAFIRNAPMMSPWEIGFIHRGIKWQTINIKKSGHPKQAGELTLKNSPFTHGDKWDSSGTSYSAGDGGILEQIRMTEQCATYGKININSLVKKNNGDFDATRDLEIFKALFRNVTFGENVETFITNSTRNSAGKFNGSGTGNPITPDATAFEELYNVDKTFSCRAEFAGELQDAFGLAGSQTTDAAKEEIIGKTINLLSAESSANVIKIAVLAQSIQDNSGSQIRDTKEKASDFTSSSVEIDDGVAIKDNCKTGTFDMYEHKTDPRKNIYFDNITGEVKMLVTLDRMQGTGQLKVRKIEYIE